MQYSDFIDISGIGPKSAKILTNKFKNNSQGLIDYCNEYPDMNSLDGYYRLPVQDFKKIKDDLDLPDCLSREAIDNLIGTFQNYCTDEELSAFIERENLEIVKSDQKTWLLKKPSGRKVSIVKNPDLSDLTIRHIVQDNPNWAMRAIDHSFTHGVGDTIPDALRGALAERGVISYIIKWSADFGKTLRMLDD